MHTTTPRGSPCHAPFFSRSKSWSLEAFAFIFTDPDFYLALRSGFIQTLHHNK
jgi:hypothetical protein